ncbi:hypothetical protein L226DRAFT_510723 [Lentinus tigrinus ALCF2SS1-7]|uniref:BTB domain-containing protein n=1 Tax=Lentinus tigrinus ALCF2SS1-6 TaxID=1328759 RepID=A0A5C2S5P8_9APHY|nr:hypothetical protein L227DRAFT_549910 [Lentinus tigrinus ALCF2SS1-6]RPD73312.1 hypothetical protein L226DRAFT_510723 [Lentinus tigrinus ALCF2SS1-7]
MTSLDDNPFADPSADVYIWSVDGVPFKVHKVILSLASDHMKNMLNTASRTTHLHEGSDRTEHDGVLSFHFPEHSGVLDPLFRLCYPVDDPPLDSIEDVRMTLEAAKKYQMREAVKITKQRLLGFAPREPIRVYAIACQLELDDIALDAAKEVLKQEAQYTYADELETIPGSAYRRLVTFCESGGNSADSLVARRVPLPTGPSRTGTPSPALTRAKSLSTYSPRLVGSALSPKPALHPFNARDADIVLATSDNVQFRAYRNIIELASPVLTSMLAGISSSTERRFSMPDPVRRLSLPESSQVLSILLRICYPIDDALPEDVHTLHLALCAAREYQMQKAIRVLQDALLARKDDPAVPPDLLYAIACCCDLRSLAAAAAKRSLHTAFTDSTFATFDKYGLSGACVQRLFSYHKRCCDAARYVVGEKWRTQLESSCRLGKWANDGQVPCWYERYMGAIAKDPWPTPATATNTELVRSAISSCHKSTGGIYGKKCRYCSDPAQIVVYTEFTRYVAETIEALENRVVIEWPGQ